MKSREIYSTNGNYLTTIDLMQEVARRDAVGQNLQRIKNKIGAKNNLTGLIRFCSFLRQVAPFVPHISGQQIRTLNGVLTDRRANCVEYTTAIGSFCLSAGLPCQFVAASFSKPGAFTHIFPVVCGVPFDLCMGQEFNQNKKNEIILGDTVKPLYISAHNLTK